MIHISANKADLTLCGRERLTAGMSGTVECAFSFSDDWAGLTKVAEFSNGIETRTVELFEDRCAVPHEVLTEAGSRVMLAVYGTDGEEKVLPSVSVCIGEVEEGAKGEGAIAQLPTPSLFEQFLARADQTREESAAAESAAAAARTAADTAQSAASAAKSAVETFLSVDMGAKMHRNIYRGAYLGNQLGEAQLAAIRDGSFDDLYIGDFWTIGGVNYRIADMDYWYNVGESNKFKKHHLVIVPDECLAEVQMSASNSTDDGYLGSAMKKTVLPSVLTKIQSHFGSSNVLSHQDCFVSMAESGRDGNKEWLQTKLDLMNEIMVYGAHIFASMNDGDRGHWNYTSARTQLALFRMDPTRVNSTLTFWLRDVVDEMRFAANHRYGMAYCMKATVVAGVRPVFAIG